MSNRTVDNSDSIFLIMLGLVIIVWILASTVTTTTRTYKEPCAAVEAK
jgi:hypothetical protein